MRSAMRESPCNSKQKHLKNVLTHTVFGFMIFFYIILWPRLSKNDVLLIFLEMLQKDEVELKFGSLVS